LRAGVRFRVALRDIGVGELDFQFQALSIILGTIPELGKLFQEWILIVRHFISVLAGLEQLTSSLRCELGSAMMRL
jgi:hypothetical protein